MKVTFRKKELMAALVPAAGISQTKNTYAFCDGLLFECPPDKRFGDYDTGNPDLCRISAFDLEKGLRTTIGCTVHEKGTCVIAAHAVLQIVRALPDSEITMTVDPSGAAVISVGKVNFRLSAASGEQFPTMPMFIGNAAYRLPQRRLRRLLGETAFAIAQNDLMRTGFSGGLFRIRDNKLTVTGCDNYKVSVSRCTITVDREDTDEIERIVPGKFLVELQRLLNDTEDEVTMIFGRKHVIFRFNGFWLFTRILDAEYPDYEKMIPASYMTEVFISRAEFLEAIERASLVAEARLGGNVGTYIKLEFTDKAVVISSVSSGSAIDETLSAEIIGAPLAIGFECRNLLDTLKACPSECERLRLRLNTPVMGVTIESAEITATPAPTERCKTTLPDSDINRFMYYVLPTRMNVPLK